MHPLLPGRRLLLAFASTCLVLTACGGGDGVWDEFAPRAPTVADIDAQSFVFTDFSHGAVFDPSLSTTTTTLVFGQAVADGTAWRLPANLLAKGSTSAGEARLTGSLLALRIDTVGAGQPFQAGQQLAFDLQADVDDGRIRLTNRASGVEQTSAPR